MKYLIIVLAFLSMSLVCSQSIDTYPGYFELRVNEPFEPVKSLFAPQLEKDESGVEYHVLAHPNKSEYSSILGGTVAKLLVREEKGLIEEVVVIYTKSAKFSKVSDAGVKMYGEAECMVAVVNPEAGGCFWNGEKYFLHITSDEHPYVEARFGRVEK